MPIAIINAWGIIERGGPMIWPILFFSILAFAIGIERFLFLGAVEQNVKKFKPLFFNALRANRIKDALGLCEDHALGFGNIAKAGLMKFGASADLIKSAMDQAAVFEIHALKKRLSLLSFIVNAAPMMGLLGTTTSLCVVFHAAQMRANALNPLSLGDMSSGIWQAMVTTSAGMLVGIISFAIYSFTATRINDVIASFEAGISETTAVLLAVAESDNSKEEDIEP